VFGFPTAPNKSENSLNKIHTTPKVEALFIGMNIARVSSVAPYPMALLKTIYGELIM